MVILELNQNQMKNGLTDIIAIEPNQQAKIVSGFIEKSNVNAVEEMVNTIDQQRKFEMHVKFIQMAEELDSVGASLDETTWHVMYLKFNYFYALTF